MIAWLLRVGLGAAILLAIALVERAPSPSGPGLRQATTQVSAEERVALTIELFHTSEPGERQRLVAPADVRLFRADAAGFVEVHRSVTKGTEVARVTPGSYFLVVRAAGHARYSLPLELSVARSVEVVLEPGRHLGVEVVVEQEGKLVPFAGATVLAARVGDLPHGAKTNAAGKVEFAELYPGPVEVDVYAPGYEPYRAVTEADLLVRLSPVRALRVVVKDGGVPVPGARVSIAGASLWPARVVETGAKGQVDVVGLRVGSYSVAATHGDRAKAPVRVELVGEAGVEVVVLELGPGTFLTVSIVDEEKHPIEGARVTYSAGGLSPLGVHEVTPKSGVVVLGPLLGEAGTVQVHAPGFVTRVSPAELPGPMEIELVRAAEIRGRVVDERGQPIPGAVVEAVGTDAFGMPVLVDGRTSAISDAHFDWALEGGNVLIPAGELGVMLGPVPPIPLAGVRSPAEATLTTDARGQFVIVGVPPGRLVVLARHEAYLDGKSRALELVSGQVGETEVMLRRGVSLSGRVVDHRGFPVTDARVRVAAAGFDRQVAVASDGTFSFAARPEEARLRVSLGRDPLRVQLERLVTKDDEKREIALELPPPREPVTVAVTDERGEPLGLAQVQLTSLERHRPWSVTRFSDAEGRVRFEEALGLSVRLVVDAPGYVRRRVERKLDSEVQVTLRPAVGVQGRVRGVRGRLPASGARVWLEVGDVTRETLADESGVFRLDGLPTGTGVLRAEHTEHGRASLGVRVEGVEAGRRSELPDLVLEPRLVVTGRVVDGAGIPVRFAQLSLLRVPPYVLDARSAGLLGRSDEHGEFSIEVEALPRFHLFGMKPGVSFGFSDAIERGDRDRLEGVVVTFDRTDEIAPDLRGTILLGLELGARGLEVYAVAPRSQALLSGIREGDLLIAIDGFRPDDVAEARELLSGQVGSEVRLTVRRSGVDRELVVLREAFLR